MRIRKQCIGFVVGCMILPGVLFGQTTREVNQNDYMAQYMTINEALAEALPGDTVLVHPGTYLESITVAGITLKSRSGPEATVIQSPDGSGDGVTVTGNQTVAVIGFRVQGFQRGVVINTDISNTRVANCVVVANSTDGFFIADATPSAIKLANNISADNGRHGFYIDRYVYDFDSRQYSSILNNVAFRNGAYGFADSLLNPKTTFGDYNCSYDNSSGNCTKLDLLGQHSMTTDPLVSAMTHYRFTSQGSPCVNAGQPTTFYYDPDGSVNDMGAYGGPEAANWWRDPFTGPTIENVTIDPTQVQPGGSVTIRATAKTE